MKSKLERIQSELAASLGSVDCAAAESFVRAVCRTAEQGGRIYCAAAGRMLFVSQGFVMRLNQMGIPANCGADTYAAPLSGKDLVVAVTSSGTTHGVVDFALRAASGPGAAVWMIGCNPHSPIAEIAEGCILYRPARTTRALGGDRKQEAIDSFQPMNCLNEQTTTLLFDAVIVALMERLHVTNDDMNARHFNLE